MSDCKHWKLSIEFAPGLGKKPHWQKYPKAGYLSFCGLRRSFFTLSLNIGFKRTCSHEKGTDREMPKFICPFFRIRFISNFNNFLRIQLAYCLLTPYQKLFNKTLIRKRSLAHTSRPTQTEKLKLWNLYPNNLNTVSMGYLITSQVVIL